MPIKKVAKKAAAKTARKSVGKRPNVPSNIEDVIAGPPSANPPGMSNPATRALRGIGVTRISELTQYREHDIAGLHGMGPKGVKALKAALKAQGRSFRS